MSVSTLRKLSLIFLTTAFAPDSSSVSFPSSGGMHTSNQATMNAFDEYQILDNQDMSIFDLFTTLGDVSLVQDHESLHVEAQEARVEQDLRKEDRQITLTCRQRYDRSKNGGLKRLRGTQDGLDEDEGSHRTKNPCRLS